MGNTRDLSGISYGESKNNIKKGGYILLIVFILTILKLIFINPSFPFERFLGITHGSFSMIVYVLVGIIAGILFRIDDFKIKAGGLYLGIMLLFTIGLDWGSKYLVNNIYESKYNISDTIYIKLLKNTGFSYSGAETGIMFDIFLVLFACLAISAIKDQLSKKTFIMTSFFIFFIAGFLGNQLEKYLYGSVTDFMCVNNVCMNVADFFIYFTQILFGLFIATEIRKEMYKSSIRA